MSRSQADAAACNRITTINATNADILLFDDFGNKGRPMKAGVTFNCYTGMIVQNWSNKPKDVRLYHVIECTNPSMIQQGVQTVANNVNNSADQVSVQAAADLLLEKTPVYSATLQISESFTYGDEPLFYIEAVMSVNQAGGGHGLIKKTGRLQTLQPGVNSLLYTMVGDTPKITVDYNPQIPSSISINNSLRMISVKPGSAEGIPEGQVLYLYVKEVGRPDRNLHCLQFTSSIREGVLNVTKDYLLEIVNQTDNKPGVQGSFVDQLITFNQGIAILAVPTTSATQIESQAGNFQLVLLDDLYKQGLILYPTDVYPTA